MMKIADVMTRELVTCQAKSTVREVAALMREKKIGGIPVLDGKKLVGIVTDSDILKLLETGRISDDLWLPSPLEVIEIPIREMINWERTREALSDIGGTPVSKVMSHPVVTTTEDTEIEEAASMMLNNRIARLPVIRGNELVGIVTRADIVEGVAGGGTR